MAAVNWFGRGVAWGATPLGPIVQSATADASYPPANLYDGQTSPVCKWASLGADYYLDASLNLVPDGDAEQATVPSSWETSGGTLARSNAVAAYKGSYEFVLTPSGTPDAYAWIDIEVPAGAYLQLRAAGQGNIRSAAVLVVDRERTMYLTAAGAWTTASTAIVYQTAASWANTTVTELRAPTIAEWGRTTGTIRIYLMNVGNGASTAAVYFDEILVYPSKIDIAALVGHNLPPTSRLRVQSFADYWHGGATTTEWDDATGRLLKPTGWKLDNVSTLTQPYLRILLSLPNGGSAVRYPQIAELVLGRTISLPRTVRDSWPIDLTDEQPRSRSRGGLWAQPDVAYPRRKFPIELDLWAPSDATEWDVIRDEMALATGQGSSPCLLLPATEKEPDWCLFGHLRESMQMTRRVDPRELSWEFEELPVPIVA